MYSMSRAARTAGSGESRRTAPTHSTATPWKVWLALGTVYVVWGSTYLAIRIAVRTLPPFLMASIRYLVAGALLYAWSIRRGDRRGDRPGAGQWLAAGVVGGLMLLGGNGVVSWAEQRVPSGLAALLVAAVPLWMAVFDRVWFRARLSWQVATGLVLGFGGIALLVGGPGGHGDLLGTMALVGAAASWAIGSLYSRSAPLPRRSLVGTGMESLMGGALLGVVGLATGEAARFHPGAVSAASWLALAYLVVMGTIVAFSAYAWVLRNARTSLVSTYAYVNPAVAVALGWLILGEPLSGRTLIGGAVIVGAVALIVTGHRSRERGSGVDEPAEGPSGEGERR